jgi:prepilin-type N-terminal cleavage/methylation domain-containing protein
VVSTIAPRRAFTLIEVLATLIILTLTAGIGYSSLSSSTKSAYSQLAQGYVAQVENNELSFFSQYGTFTQYPTDLATPAPPLVVTTAASTADTMLSLAVGSTSGTLALTYLDGNGVCQLVLLAPPLTAVTSSNTTTSLVPAPSGTACVGSLALQGETALAAPAGGSAK